MRYLLDTNIFIAAIGRSDQAVVAKLARHRSEIALSAIVLHELYFGAFNSDRMDRNLATLAELHLPVISFDAADARLSGQLRATFKRRGTPIGSYDLLIASQALARNLTVVTANVGEFSRVEGLAIENWIPA